MLRMQLMPMNCTLKSEEEGQCHVMDIQLQLNKSGALWWLSGKESACQGRRHGFDP